MAKFTDIELDNAIRTLIINNQKITTLNVRKILGKGSNSSIQAVLQKKGYLKVKEKVTPQYTSITNDNNEEHNNNIDSIENTVSPKNLNSQDYCINDISSKLVKELERENTTLSTQIESLEHTNDTLNNKILNAIVKQNAISTYLIDKLLNNRNSTIPEDLVNTLKILRHLTTKKIPLIKDSNNIYYKEHAKKITKYMIMSNDIENN
jgi:hypothetical protein